MSLHEAADQGSPEALPAFPPRARVLIADDLAENRLMLGLCCDQFGLAHEGVASGREAVEAAQSGRFDVILMDILMPGMDGMAATRAIRALDDQTASIPIIGVTTAAAPGEVLRYLACGMTDVVPKPIRPQRLAEAMSAVLIASRRKRSGRKQAARRAAA